MCVRPPEGPPRAEAGGGRGHGEACACGPATARAGSDRTSQTARAPRGGGSPSGCHTLGQNGAPRRPRGAGRPLQPLPSLPSQASAARQDERGKLLQWVRGALPFRFQSKLSISCSCLQVSRGAQEVGAWEGCLGR